MKTTNTTGEPAEEPSLIAGLQVDLPPLPPLLSPPAARTLLSIVAQRMDHEAATRRGRTLAA